MVEVIGFVLMVMIGLAIGAVWLAITLIVWLVSAIAEVGGPLLDDLDRELERQWNEFRKPMRIRKTGRHARQSMAEAADGFEAEMSDFLEGE